MTDAPTRSFRFELDAAEQRRLLAEFRDGNYRPLDVPHTLGAAERPGCRVCLYRSGVCTVQGREAEDWVRFVFEPRIVRRVLPEPRAADGGPPEPRMGVDESGKGDFFGPLVVAAACADPETADAFRRLNVRDSKRIAGDGAALRMAAGLRSLLGRRFSVVPIGPRAYNRLYAAMGSVNRILAWGHARAIENLLDAVPGCPLAVADQFGPESQIRGALMKKGKTIRLEQRPRAEADPAVAAASVLARAGFLEGLRRLGESAGLPLPKGASPAARAAAETLVRTRGPAALLDVAKCHFRTTDAVLAACGFSRADLGPDGQAVSKAAREETAGTRGRKSK